MSDDGLVCKCARELLAMKSILGKASGYPTVAACVAGVVAALGAAPASASVYQQFRDWVVSCSNGLTCEAFHAEWESPSFRSVLLRRGIEPLAPVTLELVATPNLLAMAGADATVAFLIDDAEVLSVPVKDLRLEPEHQMFVYGDVSGMTRLLSSMQDGKTMKVLMRGKGGSAAYELPLSGFTASLLRVDDVQGRTGRDDALRAKGSNPPPASAPVRDITSLDQLPQSIRVDFDGANAVCRTGEAGQPTVLSGFDFRFENDNRLIGMPCGTAGAYNQPFALYGGKGDTLKRLSIPSMLAGGPSVISTVYNVGLDIRGRELTAFFKGRGLGDCGIMQVWTLNEGNTDTQGPGTALTLKEQREKPECDGLGEDGTRDWPMKWPIKPS